MPSEKGSGEPMMAKLLVIDCDGNSHSELMGSLQAHRHEVTHCTGLTDLKKVPIPNLKKFDVAILLLRCAGRDVSRALGYLKLSCGLRPMILCVCSVYHGSRMRLDLERRGARFLYVR